MRAAVVADDLTGANIAAVLLSKAGLDALLEFGLTLGSLERDACVCSTGSRALGPEEAYQAVRQAAGFLSQAKPRLFSKRIDSTLRGSIGAEIAGAMDALPGRIWIVAPSFPSAGRTLENGVLLVNGKPLLESGAAHDPLRPVSCSLAADMLNLSMHPLHRFRVESAGLDCVRSGALRAKLINAENVENLAFLVDAANDNDMALIAKAVAESKVPVGLADSGPLTYAVAKAMFPEAARSRIVLAVGSVAEPARRQVEAVIKAFSPVRVELEVAKILSSEGKSEIARAALELSQAFPQYAIATLDSLDPSKRLDLASLARERGDSPASLSAMINQAMGKAVALAHLENPFDGLFCSGGDIAQAVCKELGASALRLVDEVVPLASFGYCVGGIANGLPIATKGGLVGDDDSIAMCARRLSLAAIDKRLG
ncbi:MAG: hypothetical protein LBT59_00950 [Clostridiales bacterium]|nr:hypothetical protein [Clostridiales bacterium]